MTPGESRMFAALAVILTMTKGWRTAPSPRSSMAEINRVAFEGIRDSLPPVSAFPAEAGARHHPDSEGAPR